MKIAILGAPGAGKTRIANKAKRRFSNLSIGDQTHPPGSQWKIIDGYVEKLAKRTSLPFGHLSTFPHNFTVIADRWVREAEAQNAGYNTITCGSIYESILYSTFSTLFTSAVEEVMMYDQLFYKTMMEALGGLEQRTYDYDAIFYLPWPDALVDEQKDTWEAVVNAKIPEALDGFGKYAVALRGTDTEKAKTIEKVVRTLWETATFAQNDQPSVSDGFGPGAASEHQSE